jgi:hypothetical protein
MAITLTERIMDLALAGWQIDEIASATGASDATVVAAITNLAATPSSQGSRGGTSVSGFSSFTSLYGNLRQLANTARPARSNAEYLGLAGVKDGAIQATGVAQFVAVPVAAGDIFSEVGMVIGKTAGSVMTHQIAALYEGTAVAEPGLLRQGVDGVAAAIAAKTIAFWKLEKPVTIAETGFVYAWSSITATTIPTAWTQGTEAEINLHELVTGGVTPLMLSGKATGGTTAAPAKLEAAAAVTTAPIFVLI